MTGRSGSGCTGKSEGGESNSQRFKPPLLVPLTPPKIGQASCSPNWRWSHEPCCYQHQLYRSHYLHFTHQPQEPTDLVSP